MMQQKRRGFLVRSATTKKGDKLAEVVMQVVVSSHYYYIYIFFFMIKCLHNVIVNWSCVFFPPCRAAALLCHILACWSLILVCRDFNFFFILFCMYLASQCVAAFFCLSKFFSLISSLHSLLLSSQLVCNHLIKNLKLLTITLPPSVWWCCVFCLVVIGLRRRLSRCCCLLCSALSFAPAPDEYVLINSSCVFTIELINFKVNNAVELLSVCISNYNTDKN